jgi:hypothetical protein
MACGVAAPADQGSGLADQAAVRVASPLACRPACMTWAKKAAPCSCTASTIAAYAGIAASSKQPRLSVRPALVGCTRIASVMIIAAPPSARSAW